MERELAIQRSNAGSLHAAILAASVVGYELISSLPVLLGIDSRMVTVPFRAAVLLLSLFLLIAGLSATRKTIASNPILKVLLLFWGLYCLRLLVEVTVAPVVLRMPAYEYLLFALGACALPMLAITRKWSPWATETAYRLILYFSAVSCVAVFLSTYLEISSMGLASILEGRLATDTLNPISLGQLGVTLSLLSGWGIVYREDLSRNQALLYFMFFWLGVITMSLAGSRGPFACLIAGQLFLGLIALQRTGGLRRFGSFVIPLVLFGIVALVLFGDSIVLLLRLFDILSLDTASSIRVELSQRAWVEFAANPLLGVAIEDRAFRLYPHNLVLEAFLATGLFGGLLLVIIMLFSVVHALRLALSGSVASWISVLYIQYFVSGMFSGALYGASDFWVLMAALFCSDPSRYSYLTGRPHSMSALFRRGSLGSVSPT